MVNHCTCIALMLFRTGIDELPGNRKRFRLSAVDADRVRIQEPRR
jgi:hypothetical protein